MLQGVRELLVPGGLLLITDSAFEFLRSRHDRAVMARQRYTLKELGAKMAAQGFAVLKQSYLFFLVFPLVCLSRIWGRSLRLGPEDRSDLQEIPKPLNAFLIFLTALEGRWIRRWPLPWGSSLLILGRKV